MKSHWLIAATLNAFIPLLGWADTDPKNWDSVLENAKGQTVYWNAWGGSPTTNAFIEWAGRRVEEDFGVMVEHVKLTDTADAVTRVLSEKDAGQDQGGAIDMIWINGANFASMKGANLLFGPFAEDLPGWAKVDVVGKNVQTDFTVPVEGYESPWAMAQVVFMYDTADISEPLPSAHAILEWAKAHPGRFTYPQPPDFLGTTFLKQMLVDLTNVPDALSEPVADVTYDTVTAPLWDYLAELTPVLWRAGRAYPPSGTRQIQLMNDGEIDLAVSFSPGAASTAIANFELPVLANFLLSPEAQANAQNPEVLGYGTVLNMDALTADERERFDALDLGIATLSPSGLGNAQSEPHPSWMTRIAEDWQKRYGVGQ